MKRIRNILITVIILGGIVAILMRNKAVSEVKAKNDVLVAPAVTVATATTTTLSDTISLVGTTVANNDVNIVSETAGRITAVHVRPGDPVAVGTLLFQIDDEVKRAAVQTAEANNEKAKKDLQRIEWLRQEKTMGDAQLETAKLAAQQSEAALIVAKRQLSDTRITSPIAGVVTSRTLDLGAYVQSATVVANIVDIATLKVRINVSESDAFRLRNGDKVAITSSVYPGASFPGSITSISAKGDESHTYPVEISLANSAAHPLKAGMFVRIAFMSLPQQAVLTIPRTALVGSIRAPQVYVVENNTAHIRDIVVGTATDTRLAIVSGLKEGDAVVVSGQNNLHDQSGVTVVE